MRRSFVHLALFIAGCVLFIEFNVFTSSEIETLSTTAAKVIKSAEQCVPRVTNETTIFCTGFDLSKAYLQKLVSGGVSACRSEIRKLGFDVTSETTDQKVPSDQWSDYINSTQRARTFHEHKVVAFKPGTGIVDCVHELVHVKQQVLGKGSLAPKNRRQISDRIHALLNEKVNEIEALEKPGKTDDAKRIAAPLSGLLERLKELNSLVGNLDEIEAHLYVRQNCGLLKCSDDDQETIVANLSQRADLLPVKIRESIQKEAQTVLREKKKTAIRTAVEIWKPLTKSEQLELSQLLSQSWPEIIDRMKAAGLKILAIHGKSLTGPTAENSIPDSVFRSLEQPGKKELDVINGSKIFKGEALGKYLCKQPSVGKPTLLLTRQATVGTVIHEYIHHLQGRVNIPYCEAVSHQQAIGDAFKSGKISRKEHDQRLLFMQAINALAEKEAYGFLQSHQQKTGEMETLNNRLMLKTYNDWLSE